MGSAGIRIGAFERWWAGLSGLDRERARYFAATGDTLPRGLFLGLCAAGVLVPDSGYRDAVAVGRGQAFPMPADVRAYVQHLSVASPDWWQVGLDPPAMVPPEE